MMLRHVINFILTWLPPSRCFAARTVLLRWGGIELARDAKVCGRGWIYGRGSLKIGDRTWLSPQVIFYTHPNVSIQIGSNCDIGPGVKFITGSHSIGPAQRRAGQGIAGAISIGDGTWIGAGVSILGGVSVGAGCVIAAGAVVAGNIPANSLAAGVPAKVKRTLI